MMFSCACGRSGRTFLYVFCWFGHYKVMQIPGNFKARLTGAARYCLEPAIRLSQTMHPDRYVLYLAKMRGKGGQGEALMPRYAWQSFAGAFLSVCLLAWLCEVLGSFAHLMLVGSFGATAAMIFGVPASPYAQPRNVLGGHLLAALCGVGAWRLAGGVPWLACGLAVACAVYLMHKTRTFHPPGGATALIAVIGDSGVHDLGFAYAIVPVGIGMVFLVVLGVLINNVFLGRRYPLRWR
jgi:hypothetical protein